VERRVSLRLHDVRYAYTARDWVVRIDALEIGAGLTLLLGPNGCGKSTLLRLLAGVEAPDSGTVLVEGHDLWRDEVAARVPLAYVPEQPDLTPYATVGEVLRLVADLRRQEPAAVDAALTRAGLAGLARRSIRELSMGQRRRAVLAAAWIGEPRVLLLDEPLETLDRGTRESTLAWMDARRVAGATLIVVTHDLAPFVASATRALTLRDGAPVVHDPLPDDIVARTALLESLGRGAADDFDRRVAP
jgi:ABC-type multidrug transport system ATPase subunit